MSKIQDALRKIQGAGRSGEGPSDLRGDTMDSDVIPLHPDNSESDSSPEEALGRSDEDRVRFDFEAFDDSGHFPEHAGQAALVTAEFREIIASIEGRPGVDGSKLILVTGLEEGAGRTFVCLNLALSLLHEEGKEVLLVDADKGNPELSRCLQILDRDGLYEMTADSSINSKDVVLQTSVAQLGVLPVGIAGQEDRPSATEKEIASAISRIVAENESQVVVVDLPVITSSERRREYTNLAGTYIQIIRVGETSRDDVIASTADMARDESVEILVNQVW